MLHPELKQGDEITFYLPDHWNTIKKNYGVWVRGKIFVRRGDSILVRRLQALNGQVLGIEGGGYNLNNLQIMEGEDGDK